MILPDPDLRYWPDQPHHLIAFVGHISLPCHERDLMLPDGKPAPPPGFRIRRYWTETEPHDSAPLNDTLPHADLCHACILGPIIPTVVSHAIVPLPVLSEHAPEHYEGISHDVARVLVVPTAVFSPVPFLPASPGGLNGPEFQDR